MAITEGILRMIAADDSHAGSLTVARRGTGGHLQTPGLAAPEHSDAERPAPHLGQDGRASAPMGRRTRARSRYARPGGTGDTFRPPAWRHLNHGLLRGQLAGRDNTAGPSFVTVDRRTRAKGTAFFVYAGRRTQGKLPGQRAGSRTARVATAPGCGQDRPPGAVDYVSPPCESRGMTYHQPYAGLREIPGAVWNDELYFWNWRNQYS